MAASTSPLAVVRAARAAASVHAAKLTTLSTAAAVIGEDMAAGFAPSLFLAYSL